MNEAEKYFLNFSGLTRTLLYTLASSQPKSLPLLAASHVRKRCTKHFK